jgi:hypothetical protein
MECKPTSFHTIKLYPADINEMIKEYVGNRGYIIGPRIESVDMKYGPAGEIQMMTVKAYPNNV